MEEFGKYDAKEFVERLYLEVIKQKDKSEHKKVIVTATQIRHSIKDLKNSEDRNEFRKRILLIRGRSYAALNQHEKAILDFDDYIKIQPSNSTGWHERALSRKALGQFQATQTDLNQAISLSPTVQVYYLARAQVRLDLMDFNGALSDFQIVLSLSSNNSDAWLGQIEVKQKLGCPLEEIFRVCDLWVTTFPYIVQPRLVCGKVKFKAGYYKEAIDGYSKWIQEWPLVPEAWIARADAYMELGCYLEAYTGYDHVIKLTPHSRQIKELKAKRKLAQELCAKQPKSRLPENPAAPTMTMMRTLLAPRASAPVATLPEYKNPPAFQAAQRSLFTTSYARPVAPHLSLLEPNAVMIPEQHLKLAAKKGEGSFGNVYQGSWNGNVVAIKVLKPLNQDLVNLFKYEVSVHATLHFPRIVALHGMSVINGSYSLVMEYMPKGSLREVLNTESLEWNIRIQIAIDITEGVVYLHGKNRPHGDLKSFNILLDPQYRAKLSDFGLARGSLLWIAPELLIELDAPVTTQSDVFSLGGVFFEIATRQLPYLSTEKEASAIEKRIIDGRREKFDPKVTPPEFSAIAEECWRGEPFERPTAERVFSKLNTVKRLFLPVPREANSMQPPAPKSTIGFNKVH